MGKKSKKPKINKFALAVYNSDKVKSSNVNDTKKVSFSFKYLKEGGTRCNFKYKEQKSKYFLDIIHRFKDLGNWTRTEISQNGGKALRCHPIDFSESRIPEDTFGLSVKGADDNAYQISVSKARGRIHGYFEDEIFYVVWFDPEHELFPWKDR